MECPQCDADFGEIEKKRYVVVDNVWHDADELFTLRSQSQALAIQQMGETIKETLGVTVRGIADQLAQQPRQPSSVSVTQDASTYNGFSGALYDALSLQSMEQVKQKADYAGLGIPMQMLSQREFQKWKQAMKHIMRAGIPKSYGRALEKHIGTILLGAMVAKEQFRMEFDGMSPFAGRFGVTELMPYHFALNGWTHRPETGGGSIGQNRWTEWIHSGCFKLGGTIGNPVRILQSGVYIIIGVGEKISLTDDKSRVTGFQMTLDGKTKPLINTDFASMVNPLYSFQEAVILFNKTVLRMKVRYEIEKSPQTIAPCILGVGYFPEAQLRTSDENFHGYTNDVITTT